MITIKIKMTTGSPEAKNDGSSLSQRSATPTQLNIFAWGISKPTDFARLGEIIHDAESLFKKELKKLPEEIIS